MFAATDTAWAPWYIARTDDKKRGRWYHLSDLLSQVPYKPLAHRDITLPRRQRPGGYVERTCPCGTSRPRSRQPSEVGKENRLLRAQHGTGDVRPGVIRRPSPRRTRIERANEGLPHGQRSGEECHGNRRDLQLSRRNHRAVRRGVPTAERTASRCARWRTGRVVVACRYVAGATPDGLCVLDVTLGVTREVPGIRREADAARPAGGPQAGRADRLSSAQLRRPVDGAGPPRGTQGGRGRSGRWARDRRPAPLPTPPSVHPPAGRAPARKPVPTRAAGPRRRLTAGRGRCLAARPGCAATPGESTLTTAAHAGQAAHVLG